MFLRDLNPQLNQQRHLDDPSERLPILYQDDSLIIVDKPSGLLTHKSMIASTDSTSLMERLRDQVGEWVYPVHRLDRATSGVVIFARSSSTAHQVNRSFILRQVTKKYMAITRGYAPKEVEVDHALKKRRDRITDHKVCKDKPPQPAQTSFSCVATVELPVPVGRYLTARYSLVEARPHTGRRHQIRRHLKHISHPIVGDTYHGKGEHNRLFRERFNSHRLLLAATEISLPHPLRDEVLCVQAPLSGVMKEVCHSLFGEALLTRDSLGPYRWIIE